MTGARDLVIAQKATATDIREALHRRYNGNGAGNSAEGEKYVCIEEARSGAGFQGNDGQCDFLAINTWPGRGMELIGHEIKVSLTDWKKELADPSKAEVFARFCNRWYVVVPAELAAKIRHEVPPAWGLLSLSDKGRLTEIQKPELNRDRRQVPDWWWIGWLAQIDRQHKRRLPHLVNEALKPQREQMERILHDNDERRAAAQADHVLQLQAKADEIFAITGIRLSTADRWTLERLGRVWKYAQRSNDLDGIRNQLRASLKGLDEFLDTEGEADGDTPPADDRP